jgi:hypothetical protein
MEPEKGIRRTGSDTFMTFQVEDHLKDEAVVEEKGT